MLERASDIEALRTLMTDSSAVDLLLIDVIMPAMNGKELVDELRRRQLQVKVLYMSGYTADVI